ncbi:MAG: dynamin family protein, partial [Zoogloeaceae bacterium]|nr:dynamin family protein [Zoogloeaceae bacterium]
MSLARQFAAYSHWRTQVARTIEEFQRWLVEQELAPPHSRIQLAQLLERLEEDRLHVAFVAEFSRGKSELINSIFFADYGRRILPSSVGRTTMCPTELLWDSGKPPCIELLPIQTRRHEIRLSEYRKQPGEWERVELNLGSAEIMKAALSQVSEVLRVTPEEAHALGFATGADKTGLFQIGADGRVEIPRWRHALINFPHPLLKQGLVILDTPGLNAIGAEPELTLSLLPRAHAVLFVLAADTGVTQSDLAVWQQHIDCGNSKRGRMVVLNKIDSLWDAIKTEREIETEIVKQVKSCAQILGLEKEQIFPVSAQKALAAKINHERDLLVKSRLPKLERALSQELVLAKQDIVRDNAEGEFERLYTTTRDLLDSRLGDRAEQIVELTELRGKNHSMMRFMMDKTTREKEEFGSGLQRYYAARSIFSRLTNQLFSHLGPAVLQSLAHRTRESMLQATFSKGLSETMRNFFVRARSYLDASSADVEEIHAMMGAAYRQLVQEYGVKLPPPAAFSLARYERELTRLDAWCETHLNTALNLITQEKRLITQKFFAEAAQQVLRVFEYANQDAEQWLRAIMAPMEIQVRERQTHLKRRMENIRRVLNANDTLEEQVNELEETRQRLQEQIKTLE